MSRLQQNPKMALMMIPGTLFWVLVGIGIAREDESLIGAGVIVALVTVVTTLTLKGISSSKESKERLRVWNEGTPAKARVISTRTNGGMNDHPRVIFQFEILPTEGAPYPLELIALISQLAVPRIQPEMEIDVKVDPNDPANVVVHESLTPYGYK